MVGTFDMKRNQLIGSGIWRKEEEEEKRRNEIDCQVRKMSIKGLMPGHNHVTWACIVTSLQDLLERIEEQGICISRLVFFRYTKTWHGPMFKVYSCARLGLTLKNREVDK